MQQNVGQTLTFRISEKDKKKYLWNIWVKQASDAQLEAWIQGGLRLLKYKAHTSFTYRKLNMDIFSVLNGSLGYLDSTQEVEWNSLYAQMLFQKIFFTS